MRGRKPVPTEVHARRGNPSKKKLPAPTTVAGRSPLPEPTEEEAGGPDGLKFWRWLVPKLEDVGILDGIDAPILLIIACAWQRMETAHRVIAAEGITAIGSQGQDVAHPAVAVAEKAEAQVLRVCEQIGVGPTARARLGLATLKGRTLAKELGETLGA